jgi:uncharacterized protein (DUF2252 family)
MPETTLIQRIKKYNEGRVPHFLAEKYKAMNEGPFRFFRGTAHLFYEDIPADHPLLKSPKAWICGDLHLENLGSFKGDNGLAYFDMNDFDEAALGPCLLDLTRFACSIYVGASELGLSPVSASVQVGLLLDHFIETLHKGYIRVLEQETAEGVVKQLLTRVEERTRRQFLTGRVSIKKGKPQLDTRNGKFFKIDAARKEELILAFEQTALFHSNPRFFRVKDVAYRMAGTGSLGMERYVMLVEGKQNLGGRYYLLDVKEAQTPSMLIHHPFHQPEWESQASRIIEIQKRVVAAAPAWLSTLDLDGKPFVVKVLQPMEDKLDLAHLKGKIKRCSQFVATVGTLSAWGILRSSGRQGSAIADDLIHFADKSKEWKKYVADYASKYAAKVAKDYAQYKKAFAKGTFKVKT